MRFYEYLGENSPKLFHAEPFFRVLQIKCLSKWPYFKKSLQPLEGPGYMPEILLHRVNVQ